MAGLVAAAEARRLGAGPAVLEKLDRPGGSMRLSSGVVWRHRQLDRFRAECPGGDPLLQRLLFERLDHDLRWLESLGAPVVARETGNELTTGVRFDPERLTGALVEAAGEVRLLHAAPRAAGRRAGDPRDRRLRREPRAVARARDARGRPRPGPRRARLHRRRPAAGLAAGAADECAWAPFTLARCRRRPPAWILRDFVALSQLYARHAEVTNERRERHETATWSEVDTAAVDGAPAARPGVVPGARGGAGERVRERSVGEMVDAAAAAGAPVRREQGHVTVETVAGVTTTLGGLAIDAHARAAGDLFACGADAGGIATGGYASGLAAALVFGRIAARAALGESP